MFVFMKLHLFNPDTDLALADGKANYLPPSSVHQMAVDLAALPMWYASPGDGVLAASAYNDAFFQRMKVLFNKKDVFLVTEPEVCEYDSIMPVPWGWNASVRRYLYQKGIPLTVLPSDDELRRWRMMASREQVTTCLAALSDLPFCCGESVNLYNIEECQKYVEDHRSAVLKAPWSGSGRGLLWCKRGYTKVVAGWCSNTLRHQGCVVAAPVYDKVEDFAMEFQSDGHGNIRFIGYSLFRTNARGAYRGNILLSDYQFEKWMAQYISIEVLVQIRTAVQDVLARLFASYIGFLGVDMMVCRAEKFLIHPCVEINLRMNMGVIACQLHKHLLAPVTTGRFYIEYYASSEKLNECHMQDEVAAPLIVKNNRVVSGYLSLVPVTPVSHYRAYIKASPLGMENFHFHNDQSL